MQQTFSLRPPRVPRQSLSRTPPAAVRLDGRLAAGVTQRFTHHGRAASNPLASRGVSACSLPSRSVKGVQMVVCPARDA